MDAPTLRHTDEQIAIFDAGRTTTDNLMVEAYAGCGKTSTLEALESHLPKRQRLYLVFNKKNADEAKLRMSGLTEVRTFNSLGNKIWSDTQYRKMVVNAKKTGDILREIINESPKAAQAEIWASWAIITDGVSRAKAFGYAPEGAPGNPTPLCTRSALHAHMDEIPDDLAADLIDAVLIRSIKQSFLGRVDYNDQVYMPALWKVRVAPVPTVMVDEYQDLSPVNHALLAKVVGGSRLIGVGDPFQNIYGFLGASAGGMASAKQTYSMTTLPLSTSFRCPSEIVRHVHWRVPRFRALRTGGRVHAPPELGASDIPEGSAIICRNNAPLFRLAVRFFTLGRSVTIAGGDIGPRIVGTMRKLGSDTLTRAQVLSAIDEWLAERLMAESKSAQDIADCMRVFAEKGSDLGQALSYANHILNASGHIYLTTGHKAKGLEWTDVYHLDPWLVRKHPDEQNKNLDYVISTRSAESLTEIDTDRIVWNSGNI